MSPAGADSGRKGSGGGVSIRNGGVLGVTAVVLVGGGVRWGGYVGRHCIVRGAAATNGTHGCGLRSSWQFIWWQHRDGESPSINGNEGRWIEKERERERETERREAGQDVERIKVGYRIAANVKKYSSPSTFESGVTN